MNKRVRISTMVVTALALAAAMPLFAQGLDSPSTTPAQGANRPVDVQVDGRQQALDQDINARIKADLQLDSELKAQTILVETINGNVRLTGQVASSADFDRAKDLVKRVSSVKNVENLLVVRPVKPL